MFEIIWQVYMVKKLKAHRDENLTDNIDPLEWQKWFKKLNKPQSTHCGYDKIIDSILKRAKDFTNSNDILDKGISNIEIIKASKRLKNGKAVGGDAICNEMIKCFVHTRFIDIIRAIFNAIYSKSYFPKLWKVGYIIPIFKSDDSFDPSNYHGITVSSCLGKLFTLVINEGLIEFLDVRNILSHYQIGFRRGYRTADHVFILNTILNSYFRIKSMYTEFQASVKLPNGVTPYFSSLVGVRQGCNLSPMLFNLFVNDIFDLFDNAKCDPVKLQTKLIHCLMYADDLLILSETENDLTKSLERLSNYAKKWKLKISAKKTKIIVFNKAGKIINVKIRMDDIIIQSCSEYTYLGTIFTPGNSFKKAQIELYKKACRAFFGFSSAVNVQAGAQVSTVRKLFNSLVCPILLYNSEIWRAFMKPKQLRNLESFKDNLFSDNLKHESLELKMAKISLGAHKKASNMAVRGDIGMYPLNIEMYVRIVKYCFHLLELAEQGNELIKPGLGNASH